MHKIKLSGFISIAVILLALIAPFYLLFTNPLNSDEIISLNSSKIQNSYLASEAPKSGFGYFYGPKKWGPDEKTNFLIVHDTTLEGLLVLYRTGKLFNIKDDGRTYHYKKIDKFEVDPNTTLADVQDKTYLNKNGYLAVQVCNPFSSKYVISVFKLEG
jgi:hypothetical protein